MASFDSILAFAERTFGLEPLGPGDAGAYAFTAAFDFGQSPLAPVPLRGHPLPAALREGLRLFGRRDDLTRNQDPLTTPENLETYEGFGDVLLSAGVN